MKRYMFFVICIGIFCALVSIRPLHAADAVVGDGTPASCTEANFAAALNTVQISGTITFNCGGTAAISLSASKIIASGSAVTIDGGNQITLSGVNTVRHFYVESNASLTVKNIILANGFDNTYGGGAILSLGALTLEGVTIRGSSVDSAFSGGAIMALQPVTIANSLIENNSGGSVGGLYLFGEEADATITGSTFRDNLTTSDTYGLGGALTTWNGADATIRSSTFAGNQARLGGAIYNESANTIILLEQDSILDSNSAVLRGGGIYNAAGNVMLDQVTLSSNSVLLSEPGLDYFGGGIYNVSGSVTINRSVIRDNHAKWGAGIHSASGDITVNNSTISHNLASAFGGGMFIDDQSANLVGVTVSNNIAGLGGGAINLRDSDLTLTNATISGNSANYAAGIDSLNSNAILNYVTFSGNHHEFARDDTGTAIDHHSTKPVTGITFKNVIFQGASAAEPNCDVSSNSTSPIVSLGFNLSSDASCRLNQAGDRSNTESMLGSLADNGGLTLTYMPPSDSPAIDAGQCVTGLTEDQRGNVRPQGTACDIGAVERQPGDVDGFFIFLPTALK